MTDIDRSFLIEELKTNLSSIALFELFRNERFPFLLDSAMDPQKLGRYSFMGANPFLLLKSRGDTISVIQNNEEIQIEGNPFEVLCTYLDNYKLESPNSPVPFLGGAVGYFSYDLCHFIEHLPARAVDDLQLPECFFAFYDMVLAMDHLNDKTYIISTGFPEQTGELRLEAARERLEHFKHRLAGIAEEKSLQETGLQTSHCNLPSDIRGNYTHEDYVRAVQRARQYIIDGDIFEVNLSQRFESEFSASPYDLYLRLRQINPAPFSSFLDFKQVVIAGSSPERFLRLRGDRVETRPIKGTIKRGRTLDEDRANAAELLGSAKDRAENMMIVDLERNDLGRVCRFGTVKVSELAILETYPTVYHLTSTVEGQLKDGISRIDLLKATFPGGSITGAPKVRSMEIIDELEPTCRSVYTGSIGYLSFNGDLDLNIVIRTFILKGNKAYFQVGGAVVYDSDPEAEYQETLDKGKALFKALAASKSCIAGKRNPQLENPRLIFKENDTDC